MHILIRDRKLSPFSSASENFASTQQSHSFCLSIVVVVTTKIRPAKNLDDVIKQWYRGDPEAGLMPPLKSWSPLDRKGKVSKAFSKRKVVITEYEKIGDDAVLRYSWESLFSLHVSKNK